MYQDDDDIEFLDEEQRVFNEKLERQGGVFVEPEHAEVDCNAEANACAPDDYPEDPYSIDNRPGTPDDVGYSYGLQSPDADDHHIVPEGRAHEHGKPAPATERDLEPGTVDEEDMWARHEALVEEDVDDGLKMPPTYDDEKSREVMEAMGDEAAESLTETGTGDSATAESTAEQDHGGFPERD